MITIVRAAWAPAVFVFRYILSFWIDVSSSAVDDDTASIAGARVLATMGSFRATQAVVLKGLRSEPGGREAAMAQAIEWRNVKVSAGRIKQFGVAGQR
jgi:hypothetical protein